MAWDRDTLPAPVDRVFILAGYAVPCSGTVVAWEFCYQITGSISATFNPGIWRITGTNDINYYTLLQSNNITYNPDRDPDHPDKVFLCRRFNIPESDQFIAPAGSVVGLYSGTGVQLLHTHTDNSIATYKFTGNQTRVNNTGDVDYNIAIRVHLGKCSQNI